MAPYAPPHLRAQRSAPRAVPAGGDAEPSQGGAETKEIDEEERPSASRVARGPSADNFGVRKAQSNGRQQRARSVLHELNVMCPYLRARCEAGCAAGCEAERADEAMVQASIKAWRCNSLHVAGVVYSLINDGLDEGIVYTCCAMGRLTHQLHREIVHFDNLPLWDEDFTTSACVRERIAAIMDDERHQRRERQEREAEAAEAAEELRAVAEAEAARQLQLAEEAEVERVAKAERAAACCCCGGRARCGGRGGAARRGGRGGARDEGRAGCRRRRRRRCGDRARCGGCGGSAVEDVGAGAAGG